MTHDPLCGLAKPCDDEIPEHGYCSMQHGVFCIHCHQWCICDELAVKYAAALRDAVEAVKARHSPVDTFHVAGMRDAYDAWLRSAVAAIGALGGER